MSDLIERLRKVRLYPDYDFTHLYHVDTEKSVDDQLAADFVHYDDAATALAEAAAEIERLRAALKPFAEYLQANPLDLNHKGQPLPDSEGVGWIYLTIGDFRRARAALTPKP